jgi:hypothetical protein
MTTYGEFLANMRELPHVGVTKKEFIAKMIANGKTNEEAEFQAKICKELGSSVLVGEEMLFLVKRKDKNNDTTRSEQNGGSLS